MENFDYYKWGSSHVRCFRRATSKSWTIHLNRLEKLCAFDSEIMSNRYKVGDFLCIQVILKLQGEQQITDVVREIDILNRKAVTRDRTWCSWRYAMCAALARIPCIAHFTYICQHRRWSENFWAHIFQYIGVSLVFLLIVIGNKYRVNSMSLITQKISHNRTISSLHS